MTGVGLDIRLESAGGGKEFLGGGGDGGDGGVAGLHAIAATEDEVFVCAGEGFSCVMLGTRRKLGLAE